MRKMNTPKSKQRHFKNCKHVWRAFGVPLNVDAETGYYSVRCDKCKFVSIRKRKPKRAKTHSASKRRGGEV
jgi:hypothetical protein